MTSTKGFIWVLIGVLLLGGSVGGAFAGGVAFGKTQSAAVSSQPASSFQTGGTSPLQQGDISPERLEQLRQQFGEGFGGQRPGGFGGGGFGGGGLSGTIDTIEGNTLVVNTPQGPLQVVLISETAITKFAEGDLADLQPGVRVLVTGQRDGSGNVVAGAVTLLPEGGELPFGGGSRGSFGGFGETP